MTYDETGLPRVVPDRQQLSWLEVANKSFLIAQDTGFDDSEKWRAAASDAWNAIEMLIDSDTFYKLVNEGGDV